MSNEMSNPYSGLWKICGDNTERNWIKVSAWSICIGFALLELWTGRYYNNPDGISYLDMSDALLKHNWQLLVNPYWSPLYPFLIGVARWLFRPSAYWEIPVVHLVNFGIFLGALAAFEFFLAQVVRVYRRKNDGQVTEPTFPLPVSVWQLVGYSLFAWSTFVLAKDVLYVTPDLCVMACVYLDAGLLLRLRIEENKLPVFLLLGITLGLGYYAKAVLFPMAFVFMAVAFLVAGGWRKATLPSLLMFLVFGVVSAPLFTAISNSVGHFTFGESGTNAYATLVGGGQKLPFYGSTLPSYLVHPLNRIHHDPDVFEFSHPFNVTYPIGYDIPYWNAGFKAGIDVRSQLGVLRQSVMKFFTILIMPMAGPIVCFIILIMLSTNLPGCLWRIAKSWPLIIPGIAGLCIYSLVLVESRYIAAFAALIWVGLVSGIRTRRTSDTIRLASITTLVFVGWLMTMVAGYCVYHSVRPQPIFQGEGGMYFQVAEALNAEGLQPGQAVAIVGSGGDASMWARLARVRIIAQIPPEDADDFWRASDPRMKTEVYDAFARAGARAVVTEETPPSGGFEDWQTVGDTWYHVHFLASPRSK